MSVCTFFGHRDTPEQVFPKLKRIMDKLITEQGITQFLVGNQGIFDAMVLRAIRELKKQYPHISYYVVLAYMPGIRQEFPLYAPEETLLPEGIETVPKRFAISWRNKWMIRQAQIIICYVAHGWGGAAQFVKCAESQGRRIINIYGEVAENEE